MLPPETPVTIPVVGVMVAIVVSFTPQVPPLVASVNVKLLPTHKVLPLPEIAGTVGFAFTTK